jgi:hypothetical protein
MMFVMEGSASIKTIMRWHAACCMMVDVVVHAIHSMDSRQRRLSACDRHEHDESKRRGGENARARKLEFRIVFRRRYVRDEESMIYIYIYILPSSSCD